MTCEHVFFVTGYHVSDHSITAREFACQKCLHLVDAEQLNELRCKALADKRESENRPHIQERQ